MFGRFFGGWKNSSCDLLDVENCLEVEAASGRRRDELRSPYMLVEDAKPLHAVLLRLVVKAGENSALDGFIVSVDQCSYCLMKR